MPQKAIVSGSPSEHPRYQYAATAQLPGVARWEKYARERLLSEAKVFFRTRVSGFHRRISLWTHTCHCFAIGRIGDRAHPVSMSGEKGDLGTCVQIIEPNPHPPVATASCLPSGDTAMSFARPLPIRALTPSGKCHCGASWGETVL